MQFSTSGSTLRILTVVVLAGGYFLYKSGQSHSAAVSGVVTDYVTKSPIKDSTVVLTCRTVSRDGYQESAKTDSDGEFSFSAKQMKSCEGFQLEATKSGYRDAQLIGNQALQLTGNGLENEIIDKKKSFPLQLVNDPDLPRAQLDFLLKHALDAREANGKPTLPAYQYAQLASSLKWSAKIASSPDEKKWLRQEYCGRLSAAWEALSKEQKDEQWKWEREPGDFKEQCE